MRWPLMLAAAFAAVPLVALALRRAPSEPPPMRPVPWAGATVAHALGSVDGLIYTNSAEAFRTNYARGYRVFEVDFRRAADTGVVVVHDWWTPKRGHAGPMSAEEFLAQPIHDSLTPLSLDALMALLAEHPDVWLMLDLKDGVEAVLPAIVAAANRRDPTLLRRMVPALLHRRDLATVRRLADFPYMMLTLYASRASDDEVIAFVREHGIAVVGMPEVRFWPGFARRLRKTGAAVYVYTINAEAQRGLYRSWGASGVLSDVLPP